MLASKGSGTKRWSQFNAVGKECFMAMVFSWDLIMRSYSLIKRYLQGRRELSDQCETCMYAQVCVCVHFHWMPSSRTYSLMSSFFFKCAATEDGEYFVYSIQKLSSNFLCNPEIWLNRFFLPKFGQGRPKTFNVIPFLCMWVCEQPEFICMGKGKKVLRPIKNPVLIGSQLFYRLRDA